MGRPSAGLLLGFLLLVLVAQAGLLFGKGVLLIDQHEGDALHLIEIVMRMGAGEWPHIDFMTPIGALAFLPVSWFLKMGAGIGHAIMGGMVLMAALMLPAIWWTAFSRFCGLRAYAFGGFLIILVTALVYGGSLQVASISMYYNRWAWAAAFVVVALCILPEGRKSASADGLAIGLGMAFLALAKITFFVALVPGVLVALVLRQSWFSLGIATIGGAIIALLVTLAGGVDFWAAYLADLRAVSASGIRPQPSDSLAVLLIGPSFLAVNACLLAGIVFLRQAGCSLEGLLLLLFAPAFVYITYQNWGNDPKWLLLLAFILLELRPVRHVNNMLGWDMARAMGIVAGISVTLFLPSLVNLTFANFRHAQMSREGFFQVLAGETNADLAMQTARMYAPARREAFDLGDPKIRALVAGTVTTPEDRLNGQGMWPCKLEMGLVGVLHQMARDLQKIPATRDSTVFVADTFSNLWLFGWTRPLKNGSPWYYGGDAGLLEADYILVPLCPVTPRARSLVLEQIENRVDLVLNEVARNDLFILFRRETR